MRHTDTHDQTDAKNKTGSDCRQFVFGPNSHYYYTITWYYCTFTQMLHSAPCEHKLLYWMWETERLRAQSALTFTQIQEQLLDALIQLG